MRETFRKATAAKIRDSFTPDPFLTVHWDGKIMESFSKLEKDNRVVILVSGGGNEKILEVAKCESGKGEDEAQKIFEALKKWKLTDKIRAMCFDTTASNTGPYKGACVLLEDKIGNDLYYLACRHHIHELMPTAIYEKMFCPTNGPDPQLFKRFQTMWSSINQDNIISGMEDSNMKEFLAPIKEDIIKFCRNQLKLFHPRDDYKEMLELSLLILGEKKEKVNKQNK